MWEDLVAKLREYAIRKYGWEPIGFSLHFGRPGLEHREPLPPNMPRPAAAPRATSSRNAPPADQPDESAPPPS